MYKNAYFYKLLIVRYLWLPYFDIEVKLLNKMRRNTDK